MRESRLSFVVYRFEGAGCGGGCLLGRINARLESVDAGERERLAARGVEVTHKVFERLFTIARPGDILLGGRNFYEVVAVEDVLWRVPYSAIYVKMRERGELNAG